jgi:hypothetical protein
MHIGMSLQCGGSVVLPCSVYKWIKKFKNGCTNVKHEEGAVPATERRVHMWLVFQPKTSDSEGIKKTV